MADGNLEDWVRKKTEEGYSEGSLKKVLEKRGHDPSIVDKVAHNQEKKKTRGEQKVSKRAQNVEEPVKNSSNLKQSVGQEATETGSESIIKRKVVYYPVTVITSTGLGAALAYALFYV